MDRLWSFLVETGMKSSLQLYFVGVFVLEGERPPDLLEAFLVRAPERRQVTLWELDLTSELAIPILEFTLVNRS